MGVAVGVRATARVGVGVIATGDGTAGEMVGEAIGATVGVGAGVGAGVARVNPANWGALTTTSFLAKVSCAEAASGGAVATVTGTGGVGVSSRGCVSEGIGLGGAT